MKPTPTPEQNEIAKRLYAELKSVWRGGYDRSVEDRDITLIAAALSVPAAAVVGEPVAWLSQHKQDKDSFWLSRPNEPEGSHWSAAFPVYRAAPSAPDGWQPDAGQQWRLDRIGEEITAGRKQNALTYLSCAIAEAASRISQQDAELERMRREVAEVREKLKDPAAVRINYLRGDIACQPLIDEARKAAFIDAAEIAEKLGSDEDEEWRSDCGGTVETRLAGARSWAFGRMRDLLFAKSEETGRG